MADEDLHEADKLGDEKDESENEEAEESVADYFAGDIAIEDAHVAKGECNMVRALTTVEGERDSRYQEAATSDRRSATGKQELKVTQRRRVR